jgi:hypothetical protein
VCLNLGVALILVTYSPFPVGVKIVFPPPPQKSTNYYVSRVLVFRCPRKIAKSD